MKVFVYVEGPADRAALEILLDPVIDAGRNRGIGIRFLQLNGKAAILNDVGRKAADYLAERPEDWVFALPDLYPMSSYAGTDNAHHSFDDLVQLLRVRFSARAQKIGLSSAVHDHFRVHCLQHDLEVLLLAAVDALRQRLGTDDTLKNRWRNPVEDQNDHKPPKRIVEALFSQYRKKPGYVDTVDAPWILKRASLGEILKVCPQRFAPFAKEIQTLAEGGPLP